MDRIHINPNTLGGKEIGLNLSDNDCERYGIAVNPTIQPTERQKELVADACQVFIESIKPKWDMLVGINVEFFEYNKIDAQFEGIDYSKDSLMLGFKFTVKLQWNNREFESSFSLHPNLCFPENKTDMIRYLKYDMIRALCNTERGKDIQEGIGDFLYREMFYNNG